MMMPWLKHVLYPFGKLVNQHEDTFEVARGWLERTNHIQSPTCKGPGGWYGLDLMCWYVYSFVKKLISVVAPDELLCIGHGRRPVETYSEGFANTKTHLKQYEDTFEVEYLLLE
jgi:hypothetical protein